MVGSISAQIALLAFAVAIAAGIRAGNGVVTVLSRAVAAMFIAYVIGKLVSSVTRLVLRDHLQRKKFELDKAHVEALASEEAPDESHTVETG